MLAFSLSLPANALAVVGMSPVAVTVWRAGLAGILAAGYLAATRAPLPSRGWGSLVAAGLGVAVGFPLLASIALQS
ncbi:MAG: EamA family transporter, partial [Nocardioidaceae bacterium]|nr:EamA family transporter [Nocardioidaceae bacterium]